MDQRLEQRPNVIPVENETKSQISRMTADGRTLTYQMTVLQQPVRARACGQGAKSSADRRPVDPPPIVELQIFEGDGPERNDITFNMNANYFLFATLEQARQIAHGRMSQERSSPPVLTGTPVAGMVYLDRPKPAGYFIFPDLSVRHEGKYRLSFSLYEEVKQPTDQDKTQDSSEADPAANPCVIHRLEVKSEPFHVFSAKKFPGLTESTSLSRMVAEQGCRVRIRRDVRMRRREPKNGSKEWDDYEDETAAQRARASATPDASVYGQMPTPHGYMDPIPRPRSASNVSHHSLGSVTRRPSLQEMGQAYSQSQHGTAPHTPQSSYTQSAPCAPAQPQQFPPATYAQQSAMQPPPPQFPTQSYPAAPTGAAQQSGYYGYSPAPVPSQQPQTHSHPFDSAPQPPRASVDYSSSGSSDYRCSSGQLAPPPPPPPAHTSAAQQPQLAYPSQVPPPPQTYQHTPSTASSQSYQSIDLYSRPPPMEPRPLSAARLPPLQTAVASNDKLEASSPISAAPPSSYYSNMHTPQDSNKRSFGNVFTDRYQSGPLRQGARPSIYGPADQMSGMPNFSTADNMSAADDDDNTSGELDPATLGMAYRRADGRQIMRALPGHS